MNQVRDMNSLDDVALGVGQMAMLAKALEEYDAPEMYWDEESDRDSDFRRQTANEIRARIDRRLREHGLEGSAIAFSEEEYRVAIEALVQFDGDDDERYTVSNLISHLQWFKSER